MIRTEEDRFKWRHALICGLLWGLVVVAAITLSQPISDVYLGDLISWASSLCLSWCCTGVTWTIGCKLAEELRRPAALMPVILAAAWTVCMILTVLPLGSNREPGGIGRLTLRLPLTDLAPYILWVNLFYGSLYALGYASTRTALRLRRRLADVRLARNEAEAKLREARLQAVRGQIQPEMLLGALDALQRAYQRDQRAGDQIFDLLIAFLRAAMPGLRSGASTLLAELAVVDRYAALRKALEIGPPIWRLTLDAPPDTLPFPPLRLLPALDRLSRGAPLGASVDVSTQLTKEAFLVQVGAPSSLPIRPMLMERLRAGMRRDLGVGPMMSTELSGPLVAELRIGLPTAAPFSAPI